MRYDALKSRDGFDILDAAEIWLRADAAALAEVEAAIARPSGAKPKAPRR